VLMISGFYWYTAVDYIKQRNTHTLTEAIHNPV
jgi:hypothetical protein